MSDKTNLHPQTLRYAPVGNQCTDTWYNANFIDKMKRLYPNVGHLDKLFHKTPKHPQLDRKCRIAMIEVPAGTKAPLPTKDLSDYNELHRYLAETALNKQPNNGRIFILENLNSDLIELFGSHFKLDPSFFAIQARSANWESAPRGAGNTPQLLCSARASAWFSFRYYELRVLQNLDPDARELMELSAERKISLTRPRRGKGNDGVGLVRQIASYWYQENINGGWDGMCPQTDCSEGSVDTC